MNDGCSATSKSNHIKKDEKIKIFIGFHDSRARLSTFDFQKFYRLSTFTCACEVKRRKKTPGPGGSGSFFDIVRRHVSFFAIFVIVFAFWPAKISRRCAYSTDSHTAGAVWPRHGVFLLRVVCLDLKSVKRLRKAVKRQIREMPFLAVDISPEKQKTRPDRPGIKKTGP